MFVLVEIVYDVFCKIQQVVRGEDNRYEIYKNENFEISKTDSNSNNKLLNINEELLKKEKRKYDTEKKFILKALEEKSEKVIIKLNTTNLI